MYESDAADAASQAALSTPVRCSICSVAPCACDRFIQGEQGFSGTAAHVQDDKCTACEYDPCACELLAMRASQQRSLAMPLYVIGEPCCWLHGRRMRQLLTARSLPPATTTATSTRRSDALPLVQKRSGSGEVEPIAPQWSRTGGADGVVLSRMSLQLFYNYFTI